MRKYTDLGKSVYRRQRGQEDNEQESRRTKRKSGSLSKSVGGLEQIEDFMTRYWLV